jgi:3-oxoadipate enol-lactonase
LAYIERGTGLPVVLLHGFPLDNHVWDPQIEDLSKDYRVIAPDLSGFGESRCGDPFSMQDQADDVHQLLVQIGALPCVLAGLSMGGYVSLAYWKKYPATLKGLILVDTRASADNSEGKEGRMRMAQVAREKGSGPIADEMLGKMITEATVRQNPDLRDRVLKMMHSCPPRTIEHALIAMRDREDHECELPSIGVPTLVIVGDKDPIISKDTAKCMAGSIPQGRLVVIPEAAHLPQLEKPQEVNQAIREYLKSVH